MANKTSSKRNAADPAAKPARRPVARRGMRAKATRPRVTVQRFGGIAVVRAYYHTQKKEERFKFRGVSISGRKVIRTVCLADVEDFADFRRTMAAANISFGGDRDRAAAAHKAFLAGIRRQAADRARERRLTGELGWHGKRFVRPGATLPARSRLVFEPAPKRLYAGARTAGTFEGWVVEVAVPATCSSRMILMIAAALAAVLLRLAGVVAGGFGFSVSGESRDGKTGTLKAAKSTADEPAPDTFGVTRAGGTAALLGHTDHPLFFDGAEAVRGGTKSGNAIVSEITRILSGGRPDMVDPAWAAERGTGRGRGVIRSVLLVTTEGRLDPSRLRGERARLVEVPSARPGSFGVIDYPERAQPPIQTAAAAAEHMERIERAAEAHHGHALPRFAARVVEDQAEVPKAIERYRRELFEAAGAAHLDGWSRSVLASFALVYAAAMLARRYGIVPWTKAMIQDAILRCWRDAMHEAVDPATLAVMTSDRLRRWIVDAEKVATVGRDFDPARVGQYQVIRDRDRGEAVALVRRESLVAPAGGEAVLDGVLAHLKRIGALMPNRETGEITRQKRLAGTKEKLRFVFVRASWLAEAEK